MGQNKGIEHTILNLTGFNSVEKNIFVQLDKYEYDLGIKKINIIVRKNRYCWLKTIRYTIACSMYIMISLYLNIHLHTENVLEVHAR